MKLEYGENKIQVPSSDEVPTQFQAVMQSIKDGLISAVIICKSAELIFNSKVTINEIQPPSWNTQ